MIRLYNKNNSYNKINNYANLYILLGLSNLTYKQKNSFRLCNKAIRAETS